VALVVLVWGVIRYTQAAVTGKEFAGQVRGIILSNPIMRDAELIERAGEAARRLGVELEAGSVRVERGGQTMLSGGGIAGVRLRYRVPIDFVLFRTSRAYDEEVRP
jgi:hypothetical protein